MVQHLMVAVDGSEGSRKAASFGRDLANQVSARLTLLFVIEPPRALPLGPFDALIEIPRSTPQQIEAAHTLLDQVAKDFPAGRIQKLVEVGDAADTICAQAEKLNVDLVVVGARGMGAVQRWFMGSVSDRVVHHATRTVVVVR